MARILQNLVSERINSKSYGSWTSRWTAQSYFPSRFQLWSRVRLTFRKNLSFYVSFSGHSTVSTQYYHRLIPQPQWIFEESFIGENHCVAVASEVSPSTTSCAIPFQMMSLEEILQDADFINITADVDEELDVFMGKSNKPFWDRQKKRKTNRWRQHTRKRNQVVKWNEQEQFLIEILVENVIKT